MNETRFHNIELYLDGKMTEMEANAFEQQLQSDPSLKTDLEKVKGLRKAVRIHELQSQLDVAYANRESGSSAGRKLYALAAAFFFIVTLGVLLFLYLPSAEERAFAEMYNPDPGLPSLMSVSERQQFDEAMIDYKLGNYRKAITQFEQLKVPSTSFQDTLSYYRAMAYLANGNYEESIAILETNTYESRQLSQKRDWYLAMAYLAVENRQKATPIIQSMAENANHLYHPEALRLLEKIGEKQ